MKEGLPLLALLVIFSGCLQTQVIGLDGVEVRDYEGKDLSSINDFRENSIRGPQQINASTYRLEVTGLVDNPGEYTYEDILNHQRYSKIVTLYCVEGWDVTILWEGVLVRDLLEEAEVMPEADTVIFHAQDGYSTSLPLSYFTENDIILAYSMNNVTLPAERGFPFQLVAEDKWGYKWVKWVTEIEVSDEPDYRGYWETRGYNQDGSVDGPVFER
ncbi:MAG: molybdopterin-dependent oxidoreductase [Candidatus Altiarchaeales archaeon]|nr:molybdopterin-dependent oxidoreductase [Candidatus Altiarchaeales archaeon]MBD3416393.1 molybdopterin-dependent oxidoreductase [Candidatus Altiarchaeales archaeon]